VETDKGRGEKNEHLSDQMSTLNVQDKMETLHVQRDNSKEKMLETDMISEEMRRRWNMP
jgi:hypothetical protein